MERNSYAVLRLLADGTFRSGAAIGRALRLSRVGVELALREIAARGIEVVKARGRGVRLAQPFDALDAGVVRRELAALGAPLRLEVLDECSSTNALALDRAALGGASGTVIACELQTAGRGRHGRRWLTGLGDALTFSLIWRFEVAPAALGGLSLAVGVGCARGLEEVGVHGVALKWPNDLVLDGAKLGGILVEVRGEASGPCVAVIGVGINIRLSATVRGEIAQPVTDLAAAGTRPARNELLARLLASIAAAAATFERRGFAAFREAWLRHHAWQGRRVRVQLAPRRSVDGVAAGVADDGALLLETARGVERFHAGEVSLRKAA